MRNDSLTDADEKNGLSSVSAIAAGDGAGLCAHGVPGTCSKSSYGDRASPDPLLVPTLDAVELLVVDDVPLLARLIVLEDELDSPPCGNNCVWEPRDGNLGLLGEAC